MLFGFWETALRKKEDNTVSKWYEEAVFYHIYPLGLTGAPKYNTEEETVHRLRDLEP